MANSLVRDGMVELSEHYVYDGRNLSQVLDDAGNVLQRYLGGAGDGLAEETTGAASITRWALADHEGSVRDVAIAGGTVVDHLVYDSFGQIVSQTSPANAMRMGYTGQVHDTETGLDYYNAATTTR